MPRRRPNKRSGSKRRKPQRRRRSAKPKSKKPSQVAKHLKSYNDPFYPHNAAPKIPDGKTTQSIGLSNRKTLEFTIAAPITNIMLFPGIQGMCVIHWNDGVNDNFRLVNLDDNKNFSWTSADELAQIDSNAIHKWRCVSQGIHISLTNNAEENDGWWEACRVGTPTGAGEYYRGRTTGNPLQLNVFPPFVGRDLGSEDMARNPSYVTGDLRDIKYTTFNLKPDGDEHEFRELRKFYNLPAGGAPASGNFLVELNGAAVAFQDIFDMTNDDALNHDFVRNMIDVNWDTIIIRVHGRIVPTGQIGRNSSLRLAFAQNQEIIYDERASNARFHTNSPRGNGFSMTRQTLAAT